MKLNAHKFVIAVVLGFTATGAWADHGHFHGHVGVFIGAPWPWFYPPYYYYPPVVTVPASPPVYIEQGGAAPETQYWYYCDQGQGYYPYVKECPGGWKKVVPSPPPR
jgi:hypothetical protein